MEFNPTVTLFRHWSTATEPYYTSLHDALGRISSNHHRQAVELIRSQGNKNDRDTLKKQLPGVCFAGRFANIITEDGVIEYSARTEKGLQEHSGIMVIDFDDMALSFREMLMANEYTYACWLSPSGTGFKALIRIADGTKHRKIFDHIRKHLWTQIDRSGVDPSRFCFESYDPEIYINPNASVYTKALEPVSFTYATAAARESDSEIFTRIERWLEKRGDAFVNGQRNTYTFKIAAACCRFGIEQNTAESLIGAKNTTKEGDFSRKEMVTTIASAYKRNRASFGTVSFDRDQIVTKNGEREIDLGELLPDGKVADVIYVDDVYEAALSIKNNGFESAEETGIPQLEFKMKRREVSVLGGYGNVGKSALMTFQQLCKTLVSGTKWAVFGPEAFPAEEYYHEIAEMLNGGPIGPKVAYGMTDAEYRAKMDWIGKHFFYCYPKDHAPTLDLILERFLELVIKEGVSGVIIDPWNQLNHDYTNGRDDQLLERDLSKCKRFANENNVFFFILAHPTNPSLAPGEKNYRCPEYSSLAGGGKWNAKVDNIMMYHRPEFLSNPDSTVCEFHKKKMKKPRVTGKRGMVAMDFDFNRRRFVFGDIDPLGELLRMKDNPRSGIQPLNYSEPRHQQIPDDFWND